MKKYLTRIAIFSAIIMAVSFSASAQIYVKVRPTYTVVTRPPAPSPAHVWVDEDWTMRGGRYEYSGGHWVAPPYRGAIWVPGHWRRHGRDGEMWVPGRWRRR